MSALEDRTGEKYGRLLVIEKVPGPGMKWNCLCDCGNQTVVAGSNLVSGRTQSCGCRARDRARETMTQLREKISQEAQESLVNQKFNRLTVLEFYDVELKTRCKRWRCLCECGKEVIARSHAILTGRTKSCGCHRADSHHKEPGLAAWNIHYKRYKFSAKQRNLEFAMGMEEFRELASQPCHYCGLEPQSKQFQRCDDLIVVNGVDRKDSSKGYVEGNLLPCCSECNFAKRDMTYEAFLSFLRRVSHFQLRNGVLCEKPE